MALPLIAAAGGALVGGFISIAAFGPGPCDVITKVMNKIFQARLVTERDLMRMYYKGYIDKAQFKEYMTFVGYTEGNADFLLQSYPDQISVTEAIRLFFRYRDKPGNAYNVDRDWLHKRLKQAGVDEAVYDEIVEANRPVPTLQDVITFAVRDVYEKEQADLAQLFSGIPDEYVKQAKERGLSEDDARLYWGAHWNLPGLTQVYEMFHRLYPGSGYAASFTEKDMDTFFNLADIAPGFRDGLKAISYNPLTRVDIRRIYSLGVWGTGEAARQRLIREYRQIGYDPNNAAVLADFTIKYYGEGRKKFTRSQVENFYNNKIWGVDSEERAVTELRRMGYDEDQAKTILKWNDLRRVTTEEKAKVDAIQEQWINGIIETEAELHAKLTAVPLEQSAVSKYMKAFETERLKRQSRLSRSEVDALYREKIIDEREYKNYLEALGYTEKDITRLIAFLGVSRTKPTALPSKDDVTGWYAAGTINPVQFVTFMRRLGFKDEYIQLYAIMSDRQLDTDILDKLELPKEGEYDEL